MSQPQEYSAWVEAPQENCLIAIATNSDDKQQSIISGLQHFAAKSSSTQLIQRDHQSLGIVSRVDKKDVDRSIGAKNISIDHRHRHD
jgi:hypothetical protein